MNQITRHEHTILGIDPGTRHMGFAVLRGRQLLGYGVHTLRNGRRPYDLLGQARAHVLASIRDHSPQIVAIEEPLLLPTKRAALVSAIAQELHERARELGIRVREISPRKVREIVVGNPKATKIDVAEALVGQFSHLKSLLPKRPVRAVLGPSDRDRYWLHAFDAMALAYALRKGDRRQVATIGRSIDPPRRGIESPSPEE
jgi:Holliday junction resolvasome RuvABC endonuclease subunit